MLSQLQTASGRRVFPTGARRAPPHPRPSPLAPRPAAQRRAFTLTEMLVATALTLIILLIFAQIFRAATATVTQQRGIGQNDARARMMSTVLRNDLQKMTFRDHQQSTSRGLLTLGIHDYAEQSYRPVDTTQRGYVYVSENDPDNDADDVLQFTVAVTQTQRNDSDYAYMGKASQISRPASATIGGFNPQAGTNTDTNQPEFDDGNNQNGAGQSRYGEVCYFVRNGTLYRRVLLIRDPVSASYGDPYESSPTYYEQGPPTSEDEPLIPADYDAVADVEATAAPGDGFDFWNDFDYAAYHDDVQVLFHGASSLVNTGGGGARLSNPKHRYGFQYRLETDANRVRNGRPVEYVNGGGTFVGRFTQQETSDPAFGWPGRFANSPFLETDLTLLGGVVRNPPLATAYDGPRQGEDILLPNVDAFDVQLWQPDTTDVSGVSGAFVNLGHSGAGLFSSTARKNANYGPRTPAAGIENNIFDTWHPENTPFGRVPYRPLLTDPLDPANPPPEAGRTTWGWESGVTYTVRTATARGSLVFPFDSFDVGPDGYPGVANTDDDGNGTVDDRSELNWGGSDDVTVLNDGIYYEAIAQDPSGSATSGAGPMSFRKKYGDQVVDPDSGTVWQCFDNRVGVPLIQITVRYRDPKSNLSRQLTIRHSLTDRAE